MEPDEEEEETRKRCRLDSLLKLKRQRGSEILREQGGDQVSSEARRCDSERSRRRTKMWQCRRQLKGKVFGPKKQAQPEKLRKL